jgi:hypothetical protein
LCPGFKTEYKAKESNNQSRFLAQSPRRKVRSREFFFARLRVAPLREKLCQDNGFAQKACEAGIKPGA